MSMKLSYKKTRVACFAGVLCQSVTANLTAILFVPLMDIYNFTYAHLGMLVAINFIAQVVIDLIFTPLIDKLGYKKIVIPSCALTATGLLFYACTPYIMPRHMLAGIIAATIMFAMACGLMEITLSPLVMAIPEGDSKKAAAFLHSFYAWGQTAVIIITTLLLFAIGKSNWNYIVFMWAIVPVVAFVLYFGALFPDVIPEHKREKKSSIIKSRFFILAVLAIFFGGAAEIIMTSWSSSFMEKGLMLPKVTGDLLGVCGFSIMFGIGRTYYGFKSGKTDMNKIMVIGSFAAVVCYLIAGLVPVNAIVIIACALCGWAVCLLWPGVIVSSGVRFPLSGAWMFAVLAIAGDLGAGLGPMVTGAVADAVGNSQIATGLASLLGITVEQASLRIGILAGAIFPLGALISNIFLFSDNKKYKLLMKKESSLE